MAQPNHSPQDSSQPGDDALPFREGEEPQAPPAGQERDLLEQIVRRAVTEQEGGGRLPLELLRQLHGIARRQRDESQTWEATVPNIIHQVLTTLFPVKWLEPQVRSQMAREIAETLLHDENAAIRLRRFWERICEGAA